MRFMNDRNLAAGIATRNRQRDAAKESMAKAQEAQKAQEPDKGKGEDGHGN